VAAQGGGAGVAVGAHVVDGLRGRLKPIGTGIGLVALGGAVGVLSGSSEEGIRGFIVGPAILVLVCTLLFRAVRQHPERGRLLRIVRAGLVLRLIFAVMHLLIGFVVYRGAVDFVGYHDLAGTWLEQFFPNPDPYASGNLRYDHFDQGSMANYVTVVFVAALRILVGPQFLGLFMVTAAAGIAAAWLFYRAYEIACPDARGRRFFALAIFLLPTVGFWSIFLGKDVMVFFWLSVATYSVARVLVAVSVRDVGTLAVAVACLMLVRAPVGIGVFLAVVMAIILRPLRWHGAEAWLKPLQRTLVALGIGIGFYYIAGEALLRFGVAELTLEAIAERAALQHQGFAATEGGGQLEAALTSTDPVSVALYLPLGMSTLLFRPFLWEAHNALAVVAGIENLFFMALLLCRLPALARSMRALFHSPFLVYAVIAFLTTAVALSFQWNLGATARLRTMALPFLLLLMADPTPSRRET
jgi:hypothetical protein